MGKNEERICFKEINRIDNKLKKKSKRELGRASASESESINAVMRNHVCKKLQVLIQKKERREIFFNGISKMRLAIKGYSTSFCL